MVNVIKMTRTQTKSKLDTCSILIDRKEFEDHLVDALCDVRGRKESWSGKKHLLIEPSVLLQTQNGNGEYAVLNCMCGSGAECAGVPSAIEVVFEGEFVKWRCGIPEVWITGEPEYISFVFHKPQYIKELSNLR